MGLVIPVIVGDFVWQDLDGDGAPGRRRTRYRRRRRRAVPRSIRREAPTSRPARPPRSASGRLPVRRPAARRVLRRVRPRRRCPAGMVATVRERRRRRRRLRRRSGTTGATAPTPFLFSDDSDLTLDLGRLHAGHRRRLRVGRPRRRRHAGPAEPGVAGVDVYVLDATGTGSPTGRAPTSRRRPTATGFYQFTGLPPGAYQVEFDLTTLPVGAVVTFQDQGADDTVDSDADAATGLTTLGAPFASGGDDPDHRLGDLHTGRRRRLRVGRPRR